MIDYIWVIYMSKYSTYWDKKLPDNLGKSTYSVWLDSFKDVLDTSGLPILDLGCGNGEDTEWLVKNGYPVISADFSSSAIERVKTINPNAFLLDMSDIDQWAKLDDNSVSFIIANLSLHYFDDATTMMIMGQIKRILAPNGILIARVNSNLDTEFGAGDGIEIEPDFYKNPERGIDKRFFTKDSSRKYFSIIGNPSVELKTIQYIGKNKQIFEIVVRNNKELKYSKNKSSKRR